MKTWTEYLRLAEGSKALEKEEERLGMDLDGDNEKGEPAEHRRKVLGKKKAPPAK